MKVPLLDLSFQNGKHKKEIMAAIEGVFDSSRFILGDQVKQLEKSIADYSGVSYGVGVSSGTDALLVSLMAIGLKAGDEVITTPYTFFSTVGAIVRLGAKPVFVDIDPVSYNMNPALVEKAITPKTKAIIPVHLYGQNADIDSLLSLAKKNKLAVIEDAAQAIGAQFKDGTRAGSKGDLGCFSFFPSKNLGCFGDGGMVVTSNEELANKVTLLRGHGAKPKYYHKLVGGNFRLDALQAAILNVKLPLLDDWTKARQKNADYYDTTFGQSQLVKNGHIQLPKPVYDKKLSHYHIYNQYIIRSPKRDALLEFLKKNEIGVEIYYPVPLHLQDCFKDLNYKQGDFPEAEKAAQQTLALPIFPGLTEAQQNTVVSTMEKFYG